MTTRTLSNFVAGDHADATDGRTSELVDPVTGEVFMEAALSSEADVDRACRAAAEAFETWRDATPADRSPALLRLADAMESRAEELTAVEVENTGKPFAMTHDGEVAAVVDQVRFFAGAARCLEDYTRIKHVMRHIGT